MNKTRTALVIASAGLMVALVACQRNEGPAERAGKQVDEVTQKAGEKIEQAGEKVKETAEQAGEKIKETAEEAKKKLSQ